MGARTQYFCSEDYTLTPWSTKTIESDLGTFHTDFDIQCAQAKPVSIKTKHVSIEKLPWLCPGDVFFPPRNLEKQSPAQVSVSYDYKVLNAIKINKTFLLIYLGTIV